MKDWKKLSLVLGMAAMGALIYGHTWALDEPHDITNVPEECNECHGSHGSSYPKLLGKLCESCHFAGGPASEEKTHSSLTTDNSYGDWHLYCWDCHNPHTQEQDRTYGTTYGMFVRVNLDGYIMTVDPACQLNYCEPQAVYNTVTGSAIEFKGPANYVDADSVAGDDICRVCHKSTSYYRNTSPGAPEFVGHPEYGSTDTQPGGNCLSCHFHANGFSAGSCTSCHSVAQPDPGQYRRQVTGAGGDFTRTSHHVDDAGGAYEVADADCDICHDQSSHQGNADPSVLLKDPDGGAGHAYDGTGASTEPFCLGCHDADGYTAEAGQPFGSGVSPMDINSVWAGSPHDVNLASEACMGCHGGGDPTRSGLNYSQNAHGSALGFILSPVVAGEAAAEPSYVCWGCHDADGPASTNIEGEFSQSPTARFTSANGGALNPHHDVTSADTAYSGAFMSCSDCHDPHSSLLLADPDPGDGVVPAAGNSWAGSSWESEFCLDCHDNTFPGTITPPTNALEDILTAYSGDQHGEGLASKNVSLRSGSGYTRGYILDCTACHNPGHGDTVNGVSRPNAANLRSVIYASDGVTPLTPDTVCVPGEPYTVLLNAPTGTDACRNGQVWCSTCHPNPMGGNKDQGCISGSCHNHGMNSF